MEPPNCPQCDEVMQEGTLDFGSSGFLSLLSNSKGKPLQFTHKESKTSRRVLGPNGLLIAFECPKCQSIFIREYAHLDNAFDPKGLTRTGKEKLKRLCSPR